MGAIHRPIYPLGVIKVLHIPWELSEDWEKSRTCISLGSYQESYQIIFISMIEAIRTYLPNGSYLRSYIPCERYQDLYPLEAIRRPAYPLRAIRGPNISLGSYQSTYISIWKLSEDLHIPCELSEDWELSRTYISLGSYQELPIPWELLEDLYVSWELSEDLYILESYQSTCTCLGAIRGPAHPWELSEG